MRKAPWLSLVAVLTDMASLVFFGFFLWNGPVTGLIEPGLSEWWVSLLMVIRFGFFLLLGLLLWRQLNRISPYIQKINTWFTNSTRWWKIIIHFLTWVILIGLGSFQLILDIVYIFLNYTVTSNASSLATEVIRLGLLILSILAFSALCTFHFRQRTPESTANAQRLLEEFPVLCLLTFALSCILFPFFTCLLTLRLWSPITPSKLPSLGPADSSRLYAIAQIFFSILILNFLHIEIAVQASSESHSFIYYLQRLAVLFVLWYVPYKGMLWLANANRTRIDLVWGILFGLGQVILVYFLV